MNPKELENEEMQTGILDAVKHQRLIADIEHVRDMANIPMNFITHSMKDFCPMEDVEFVMKYHKQKAAGIAGMLMVGSKSAEDRMMAMCGAYLRNFIDARVVPLNTLLDQHEKGNAPSPTVLLIPNLFIRSVGKALPAWKIQNVYDLLMARYVSGKMTIAYTEDLDGLGAAYGQVFLDHFKNHYKIVE